MVYDGRLHRGNAISVMNVLRGIHSFAGCHFEKTGRNSRFMQDDPQLPILSHQSVF